MQNPKLTWIDGRQKGTQSKKKLPNGSGLKDQIHGALQWSLEGVTVLLEFKGRKDRKVRKEGREKKIERLVRSLIVLALIEF